MARAIQGHTWGFESAKWEKGIYGITKETGPEGKGEYSYPVYASLDDVMTDLGDSFDAAILALVNRYLQDCHRNDANSGTSEPKSIAGKFNKALKADPSILNELSPELKKRLGL